MRICHINLAKSFRGGERQTLLLIQGLSAFGVEQTLICRDGSVLADKAREIADLRIRPVRKPFLLQTGTTKNSDLLHVHEGRANRFAFLASVMHRVPYVITRRIPNLPSNNFLTRLAYQRAVRVIALSHAIERSMLGYGPTLKTAVIPSMRSDLSHNAKYAEEIRVRFKNKILVGHIGALVNHHKGQQYIIEAAAKLQPSRPDVHFILLGNGADEDWLKQKAAGLENLTFAGFVDNVGDYLAAFDVFLFPSLEEGLGSILLDAMQFGLPIIASNVDGIPDIVRDQENGILIPPRDSDAIVDAIEKLLSDDNLRAKLAAQGRQSVENFTPHKIAQRYLAIYREVLDKGYA